MTALRFPKADGSMLELTEQVHASRAYTRRVRVSVRHIVCYYPAGDEGTTMSIEGRPHPIRVLHTPEELDELIAACDQTVAPLDLAPAT